MAIREVLSWAGMALSNLPVGHVGLRMVERLDEFSIL
jgi:hypothetical protein